MLRSLSSHQDVYKRQLLHSADLHFQIPSALIDGTTVAYRCLCKLLFVHVRKDLHETYRVKIEHTLYRSTHHGGDRVAGDHKEIVNPIDISS